MNVRDVLAVARIVRLLGKDKITEPLRVRALMAAPPWMKLKTLLTCPWCLSIWVGGGMLIVRRRRAFQPLLDLLAMSYVVGEMETVLAWLDVTREAANEAKKDLSGRVLVGEHGQELSSE